MADRKSVNPVSGRMDPMLIVIIFVFNVSYFDEFGALGQRGRWVVSCRPVHRPVLPPGFAVRSQQLMSCFWFSVIS